VCGWGTTVRHAAGSAACSAQWSARPRLARGGGAARQQLTRGGTANRHPAASTRAACVARSRPGLARGGGQPAGGRPWLAVAVARGWPRARLARQPGPSA